MKHKWILALCAAMHTFTGFSQSLDWGRSAGNSAYAYGRSVATDGAGNVITVGSFQGTVDFDPGPGTHNLTAPGTTWNAYIQKLDADGNLVFAHGFGATANDEAYDVAVGADNSIYMVGYFTATVDFDPGAGTNNLTSVGGGMDGFVLRLNAAGTFISAFRFGDSYADVATTVSVKNGVYAIGGTFKGAIDLDPDAVAGNLNSGGLNSAFVACYSASGLTYAGQVGDASTVNSLKIAANGDVYFTGQTDGGDFDPRLAQANLVLSSTQAYVCKWSATGTYYWAKAVGGPAHTDDAADLELVGSSCIVTGRFDGVNVDFDPSTSASALLSSAGSNDGFVLKLDGNGNYEWAKVIANGTLEAYATSVAVNANNGDVYIAGAFQGTADFNPGTGTMNLASAGARDGFIVKLDASGAFLSANKFGSSGYDIIHALCSDAVFFHFTGYFTGTMDIDPGASITNLVSTGGYDMMVVKWRICAVAPMPQNTTASSALSICGGSSTVLTGTGTGVLGWYSAPTGGTYLGGGGSYNTPTLTATTSFYLQDSTCSAGQRQTFTVTVLPAVADQAVSLADATLCEGEGTTVDLASSEIGTTYYLRNDADNSIVAGPVAGTGTALSLPTGSLSSTTTFNVYATGASMNNALDLDGVNDYVQLGSDNRGVTNAVTVQAKVKAGPAGASQFIVYKYDASNGYLLLIDPNGKAKFDGRDGIDYQSSGPSTTTVTDNAWHTLTGVHRANGTWEIYVDGVLEHTASASPDPSGLVNNANLFLGMAAGNYANITVDELAIFNVALPASTIQTYAGSCLSGTEAGLTGFFNMNETSGSSILDGSATGMHGLVYNASVPACWVTGDAGCAGTMTSCPLEMSNTATVNVSAAPAQPTITASGATTFCDGGSVALTSSAGNSYLWSNGATGASITVTASGTYCVQVSNAAGCQSAASASTTVTESAAPAQPTITANGATTFCEGGSVTLTSSAGNSYLWSNGATGASITVAASGAYSVQVANAAGCQSAASATTTVTESAAPAQPTITADGATTFCDGGSVPLTSSTGKSYLWSNGATGASITVAASGAYSVQVSNAAGCQSAASAATTVTESAVPAQPTITADGATTFCDGGSVTLTSSAGNSYLWSNGATGTSITVAASGSSSVQVANAAGCQSAASAATTVMVNAAPVATATISGGTLTATPVAAVYQWVDCDANFAPIAGATDQTFTPTGNGNFAVIVTENGCADTSDCVQVLTTGMAENGAISDITVYPNPSHGNFTVDLGGNYGQASLQLVDAMGRTVAVQPVANSQRIHLDVDVPQGVYFVVINGDARQQAIRKVIVE